MKRSLFLIVLFMVTGTSLVTAQDKVFTASDYLNPALRAKSIFNLAWRGDMDAYTYTENNCLLQKKAGREAEADTLATLGLLSAKMSPHRGEPLQRFPMISWIDANRFYFISGSKAYLFDIKDNSLKVANEYDSEAQNVTIDKQTLNVAYTLGSNLFVAAGGQTIQVSNEAGSEILYGHVPSRNEFGINSGMYWSPDGRFLAFYRIDQSEVTEYPLVETGGRIAEPSPVRYPMAGMKSQKVSLGIFSHELNEIVYLKTPGPENQYITSVTWDPSGRYIYAGILNRDQDHLSMNKYDASTGGLVKTLFEEQNSRYVEPGGGLYFPAAGGQEFIWQSRRDGWNHIYLYNTEGVLIKQITSGDWEVTRLLGFDPQKKRVYYEATRESPLERHLYATDIKTGKTDRLTDGEGVHRIMASGSMNYFIDDFSGLTMARAYYLLDGRGNMIDTLLEDANPYKDYKTGEMSIFSVKADDGVTDLWCRLIRPVDFDPSVKYPVMIYVYGGPHAQMINKSWTGSAGFFLNYMAQKGYVVFTLDNRGSAGRGFEFESIIHRQLGDVEMADQMAGVRYLKSLGFVDTTRIGVHGWSYGGFMTVSLMLRQPGVFKVACAGGPVIDWKWYEVMYGERYMDTPMKNPEGYERSSLLRYAGNLEGKMLLIHGTNDDVVVWQNSLSLLDECIKQGRQVDYFVYPGAGHNMVGRARVHLFEKIAGYFDDL